MTNSRSVAHSDVDISSWVEPLHHFPRETLEEFDLVGAIAKKFGPFPWNPHVWAYFQANTTSRVCPLIDIGQYVSHTMSSRYTFRSSTWRCFKNNLCVNCSKVPVPRASNWWISWPPSWITQSCCCWVSVSVAPCDTASASFSMQWILSNDTSSHFHSPAKAGTSGLRVRRTYPDHNYHHSVRKSQCRPYSWPKSEILAFSRGTFGCCAFRRFVILKSWNALFVIGDSSGVFLVTITSLTNWSYWSLPLS